MCGPGKPAHSGKSEAHSGSLRCEDTLISKGREHNGVPWGLVSCASGAAEVATVFTPERRVWFLVTWRRSGGMLKSVCNQTVQCSVSLGVMCSATGRSRAWQQSKLYPTGEWMVFQISWVQDNPLLITLDAMKSFIPTKFIVGNPLEKKYTENTGLCSYGNKVIS